MKVEINKRNLLRVQTLQAQSYRRVTAKKKKQIASTVFIYFQKNSQNFPLKSFRETAVVDVMPNTRRLRGGSLGETLFLSILTEWPPRYLWHTESKSLRNIFNCLRFCHLYMQERKEIAKELEKQREKANRSKKVCRLAC